MAKTGATCSSAKCKFASKQSLDLTLLRCKITRQKKASDIKIGDISIGNPWNGCCKDWCDM